MVFRSVFEVVVLKKLSDTRVRNGSSSMVPPSKCSHPPYSTLKLISANYKSCSSFWRPFFDAMILKVMVGNLLHSLVENMFSDVLK